ncbi:MAG: DUF4388 domain-containing protein [Calditrichia bacterium]|nr:DUF4388 domain-containing protein [Calditrichota bacterium]MCB0287809.1 DUF4388 domain-containing protein [Calditrichota bacterium]MCB9069463.1 DUF4388 domain-containing protein [Calditrichia bacterium]
MFDALIYLTDPAYEPDIQQIFENEKCKVIIIDDLDNLVSACEQEFIDIAMVWPSQYERVADVQTLLNNSNFAYIPVVAVTTSPEETRKIQKLPVADVLQTPLLSDIFFQRLRNVLEDVSIFTSETDGLNWEGSIEEYNLLDLIPMIEKNSRDAELQLHYKTFNGTVSFFEGNVIDAEFHHLKGMPALEKLALLASGHFRTTISRRTDLSDHIGLNNQSITLQLLEQQFSVEELSAELPGYTENIRTNPFVTFENASPIHKKIIDLCQEPKSVLDVLLLLEENVVETLKAVKELFQLSKLDYQFTVERAIRDEEERSGLDRFFSIFKKKDQPEIIDYSRYQKTEPEEKTPELNIPLPVLSAATQQKLQDKLKGLSQ